MNKLSVFGLLTILVIGALFAAASSPTPAAAREPKILAFETMVGLPSALTGTSSNGPLRGLSGGGLPWNIASARGTLTASGHLEIEVKGLVFAAGPNAGANTISSFGAIVSCVTSNGSFDNIFAGTVPATTGPAGSGGGDAQFDTAVTLPQPCIAPIIFVTSPGGAWFAATGK
jgi:hypothetical protein